jgi:exodeoxyribonuclease-1
MSSVAAQPTFYWHDYETFGTDPRRDRPSQFAGQRTTLELDPVGEPLTIFCQPAPDILPQPVSCLITGISPQRAARDGLRESEFAARVHEELAVAGTCGAGFNSIRFDDEFTRNLLYRNFYDPYEREWKDGNSRWDIIDLARMCYALRPQGIEWPRRDDGAVSFRLEDLSAANGLAHAHAHDAQSDVQATIALARLLRHAQPRLWDFHLGLRRKQEALNLLDYVQRTPVLHVSARFSAERGCLAIVVPLAAHPDQPNSIIVYDLDTDPQPLLELDAGEIADRVFASRADLPEDIARIPLKLVRTNRSPALAPLSVLKNTDVKRINLDVERALRHLQLLQNAPDVADKVRRVFARPQQPESAAPTDAELAIYNGFSSDSDRRLCAEVRRTPPAQLTRDFGFRDPRLTELLFRYRARNHPETLDATERARWDEFRRVRLTQETPLAGLTLDRYQSEIAALRSDPANTGARSVLLDQLEQWGRELAATL